MSVHDDQNNFDECPLCLEPFEMDDFNFFPCTCGYQICRFCWHRIRTDENGLCPACRKQYPEDPADYKPLSVEELQKIKNEKRQKDQLKKQKMSESRKHLANVRVVQKNLVFVVGLPARLADSEVLKKYDYFGKFGKIHKVVVNQSTTYAGSQVTGPSASAYVTYCKPEDALRAIKSVNNIQVDGRTLKASLGTTKYCSHFLKNQQCPKTDCMYLHELGDEAASFTKEDMQQGKHQEYEKKLQDQILGSNNRKQAASPPPQISTTPVKENWPCTVQNVKESRTKTKESSHSQKVESKSSRPKSKHTEGQKSKRSKSKSLETVQSNNVSKSAAKEENSAQRKSQKNKHKDSTSAQSSGHSPTSKLENVNRESSLFETASDILEMNNKNAQTTYVHITDQQNQSKTVSASIKIARSESPVLPSSPISSSSSSLFTPFGSLSSNFLSSSSPSPPPSNNSSLPYVNLGSSSNIQEDISQNDTIVAPAVVETKRFSPDHMFEARRLSPNDVFARNLVENESLFSHMNYVTAPSECSSYNGHLNNEETQNSDSSEWNTYSFEDSQKNLPEDDLDFDPWNESSKGLAEMMAKEAVHNPPSCPEMQIPPGYFQPIKTPVPNQQRISVPPPGFCSRQVPQINSLNHLAGVYGPANTDFIPCKFPSRQTLNGCSHYYPQDQQQNPHHISNQFKQQQYSPQITHESLMENLRKKKLEEQFRSLLPEVFHNLNSRNMQKTQNQNGSSWNNQGRGEFPWLSSENPNLSTFNLTDRNNAQIMKALQQLAIQEENTNHFGRSTYVNPFPMRGQWTTAQCPPPGFVAPNRSSVSSPFQHMQVNQKI